VIRTLAPHEWGTYRDLRLRALADSPQAFGRTLAEEQARPDAEWVSRLSSGTSSGWDLPLVAEVDGEPIGMAWGRIERSQPETAHLYQMWVAPGQRRLGAGRMLLEAVIAWAKSKDARALKLGVALGNSPALRLYTRAGFEPAGEPQPLRQGSDLLELPMRLKL
jgi:ribosomal protein S18 acetylase RimI-like enzyme